MTMVNDAAGSPAAEARYNVKLNGRFEYLGHLYLPGHHHVVDQAIYDAMSADGKVSHVEQLS